MKTTIKPEIWAIVGQEGKVIQRYRYKSNADKDLIQTQKQYFDYKLKVVYLENEDI